jgi:hypothetical protein
LVAFEYRTSGIGWKDYRVRKLADGQFITQLSFKILGLIQCQGPKRYCTYIARKKYGYLKQFLEKKYLVQKR